MIRRIALFTTILTINLPLTAHADLNIINNSDFDSTCVVNDGMCSGDLGLNGVTKAHSSNQISHMQLLVACGFNTAACKADVYMTDDCSGPKVGSVTLDINEGITDIKTSGTYHITADNPFQIQIDLQ